MYHDSITLYEVKWLVFLYSWESLRKLFDLFITINGKETSLCFIKYCYIHNDSTEA